MSKLQEWEARITELERLFPEGASRNAMALRLSTEWFSLLDKAEGYRTRAAEANSEAYQAAQVYIQHADATIAALLKAAKELDRNMGEIQTAGWMKLRAAIAEVERGIA